ncbi:penicillin acylase family protein [Rhizobium sp. NPDC090279]|uniref:penicillin acylase family protein n=1 Tax=Rhizobium sp. NPDC090279 TaxID=3364499 RepID=UPI00383B1182
MRKTAKAFDQMLWLEDPLAPTTVPAGGPYHRAQLTPPAIDPTRFAGLADEPRGSEDDRPRASNIWILGPKKTTDGNTILVNGPRSLHTSARLFEPLND